MGVLEREKKGYYAYLDWPQSWNIDISNIQFILIKNVLSATVVVIILI